MAKTKVRMTKLDWKVKGVEFKAKMTKSAKIVKTAGMAQSG